MILQPKKHKIDPNSNLTLQNTQPFPLIDGRARCLQNQHKTSNQNFELLPTDFTFYSLNLSIIGTDGIMNIKRTDKFHKILKYYFISLSLPLLKPHKDFSLISSMSKDEVNPTCRKLRPPYDTNFVVFDVCFPSLHIFLAFQLSPHSKYSTVSNSTTKTD